MVNRNIIPPFPFGDPMAGQRWVQSIRDLVRKSTVEINKVRDAVSGGAGGQNLLSSSWLNPSAADEFELTTLDAVHRYYLGLTRGTDQVGLLSEMGKVPGDTLSGSVEIHATGGQVGRIQLVFTHDPPELSDDPADIVLGTENGTRVDKNTAGVGLREQFIAGVTDPRLFKEFAVSKLENVRIPDLATHVQFNVISDSTSTAGTLTWRRAMLNGGTTALPYSAPPLRSDRETDMVGADTYLEFTGAAAADKVTIPHNALWDIAVSTEITVEVEYITFAHALSGRLIDMFSVSEGWLMGQHGIGGDSGGDFRFQATHTDGIETLDFDREDRMLFKRRHWAWTRDTSGVMKMYLDGRLSDDTYTNNNDAIATLDLLVGVNYVGGVYSVRIWDVKRTQAQLIDDRHTIFADSTTNLRGDWQFNENSGKIVKNHGDVANTDGVISGTGFRWRGGAAGSVPDLNNLPTETSIAAGDFIPMVDITDDQPGKITFSDFESSLTAASLTVSGVVELATVAETNTGTDATRAVTPDGLDGWTGSAQIVTVGTLSAGDVTAQVSAASLTLAGKIEIATITETNTGTDATRAVSPDGLDGWTGSAQVVTVGTLSAGNVTSQVDAASLTVAGKIEVATGAETNTGTDAGRAVSPDGLDDWTGSAQIDTVGTLSSGDVTSQVSASSESLAGKVELATDAETVTGTDTARAITPANATAKMSAPGPIGDTTPSTGAFTTLDATGLVTAATQVLVGDTISRAINAFNPSLQVTGTGGDDTHMSLQRFSADDQAPSISFGKSRGATIGDYSVVTDNDIIIRVRAFAADGGDFNTEPARIQIEIDDSSPAANSIGGAIVFMTAPGVSADDIVEVGRFTAAGQFIVGGIDVRRASSLTVDGVVELATVTETNTGTDATRAVTPDGLDGWTGSAQVVTVGTLSAGDVTSQVSAASLTLAGKIEIATVTETNTGTDATRAVSPDGLDGWTGSAQIVTVGTLSAGNATAVVDAASATAQGRVELATDAETVTGTDTARAITPANATAKMSAPGPVGDTTPSTGEFTSLIANSNHAMEGYSTGRNVIRAIGLRLQPGATPGTNINATDISAGIGFNIPSITDGTDIAKSGSSGSFALDAAGTKLTMDITENIVGMIAAGIRIHDLNSSSTTEMYTVAAENISNNLRIQFFKRGSPAAVDLTTIFDTGDLCDIRVSFVTST